MSLVMGDSPSRLKSGISPKMKNSIILKMCACEHIFTLTGARGARRDQGVISSAGIIYPCESPSARAQGVGGHLPQQTTLKIAHPRGQWGQSFSAREPVPQGHSAKRLQSTGSGKEACSSLAAPKMLCIKVRAGQPVRELE